MHSIQPFGLRWARPERARAPGRRSWGGPKVLQYTLQSDGRFGPGVELASGLPGDDFAIGHEGSLLNTTHPYHTLIRVYPDGRRFIIGDARQHIVGATDAVFGSGVASPHLHFRPAHSIAAIAMTTFPNPNLCSIAFSYALGASLNGTMAFTNVRSVPASSNLQISVS